MESASEQGTSVPASSLSSERVYNRGVGARLTDKGQVTIPKHVRDGMGLRPGDEVEFVAVEGGGYRLRKVVRANPFSRYRGHLAGLAGRDPDRLVRELRGDPGVPVKSRGSTLLAPRGVPGGADFTGRDADGG